MIDYLELLVTQQKPTQVLAYAERLLLERDNSLEEILRINCALANARVELREYHGAVVSGELAVKLAQDLKQWDYFGKAAFLTGAAHLFLRQSDEALTKCLAYLERVSLFTSARVYEAVVWYNLGFAHMAKNDFKCAAKAYQRALETAERIQDRRKVHGARQGLIYLYLKTGEFARIPELLAQSGCFLRSNPDAPEWQNSRLWHLLLRSEYALLTNRLRRAEAVANRGLKLALNAPHQRFHFHMVLAGIAQRRGQYKEAIGHSLSARVCAMSCRRFDLESEAADLMYNITKANPSASLDLDHKYITEVLYVASYVPGH